MTHRITTLLVLLAVAASPAFAADNDGHYAVKGAGNTTCQDFLAARAEGGQRYFLYGGWIEGFLSAANLYEENTFDIVPWQNTDVLATALAAHCRGRDDTPFHLAVARVMQSEFPDRLKERSALVGMESGDKAVAVYAQVLRRLQERLRTLGHYDAAPTGADDAATREALRSFQQAQDLEATGLPDQVTLIYLFTQGSSGAGAAPTRDN
jgi:hypothetical protein